MASSQATTSSLKAQRLADNFLGQLVELLSVFTPHLRGVHVGTTFVIGLCGVRREWSGMKGQTRGESFWFTSEPKFNLKYKTSEATPAVPPPDVDVIDAVMS